MRPQIAAALFPEHLILRRKLKSRDDTFESILERQYRFTKIFLHIMNTSETLI